jgi:hypothetical protein
MLPNWPRLMDTQMAASYLAVGESSFRALAARGGIRPVDLGLSVTRWRREDLDGLVDKLPARGADCGITDTFEVDVAEAALERVRRRQGKKR